MPFAGKPCRGNLPVLNASEIEIEKGNRLCSAKPILKGGRVAFTAGYVVTEMD